METKSLMKKILLLVVIIAIVGGIVYTLCSPKTEDVKSFTFQELDTYLGASSLLQVQSMRVETPTKTGTYRKGTKIDIIIEFNTHFYDNNFNKMTLNTAPKMKIMFGTGTERSLTATGVAQAEGASFATYGLLYSYTIQDRDNGVLSFVGMDGNVYDQAKNYVNFEGLKLSGAKITADTEGLKLKSLKVIDPDTGKEPETGVYKVGKTLKFEAEFNEGLYGPNGDNFDNYNPVGSSWMTIKFGNGDDIDINDVAVSGSKLTYYYTIKQEDNGILTCTKYQLGGYYDNVGNSMDILRNVSLEGKTIIADNTAPIVEINPNGNQTVLNAHTTKVTIADNDTILTKKMKAQDIKANDYGKEVVNYTSTDVKWKIFYADDENIYLIADDYVDSKYVLDGKGGTKVQTNSAYERGVILTPYVDYTGMEDIDSTMANELLKDYYSKYSTAQTDASKATAYLLDTEVWSRFVNSEYADYAIGTPTLELFAKSYNATHPNAKIELEVLNKNGYSFGTNSITTVNSESLYVIESEENAKGMWIASPCDITGADTGSGAILGVVDSQGNININARGNVHGMAQGLRPVVRLNSDVVLSMQTDGTYKIVEKTIGINKDSLKYVWRKADDGTPTAEEITETLITDSTTEILDETQQTTLQIQTPLTKNGVEGEWKLWVYAEDKIGNYTIVGSEDFRFDNTAPTITISPISNEEWNKSHSATIKIEDLMAGLAEGAKIKYAWNESNSVEPTEWETLKIPEYTNGEDSIEITVSSINQLTGKYYLWVKPETLKDTAGNAMVEKVISNGTFWFDNQAPEVKVTGNPEDWTMDDVTLTIDAADEHSGLATEPYSFDGGETWTNVNQKTYDESGITEVHLQVKDDLGNIAEKEIIIKIRRPLYIDVEPSLTKLEYDAEENFNLDDIKVIVTYDTWDEEEAKKEHLQVIGGDNLTCRVQRVEIQHVKNPEVKTYVNITVRHKYGETIVEPTCTEFGYIEHKCEYCKESYRDSYIDTKHDYETTVTEPTCTELGYITYTCTKCEHSYTDEYKNATGHKFTNYTSNNDATCTEDGTKTATCDNCEEKHTTLDRGSKLGHNMSAATCTQDSKCQREGCTHVDVGSKLPHNYEDGICKECNAEEPKLKITSETYTILQEYITKIPVNTTLGEFKTLISTNAQKIEALDKNNKKLTEEDKLATGITLKLTFEGETRAFKLVVMGDVNGDSKIDFKDMISINKHRLNKTTLDGEYQIAADVNGDDKIDFKDMIKINKFRLNKITQLFGM